VNNVLHKSMAPPVFMNVGSAEAKYYSLCPVGEGHETYVIAEAGTNHNGRVNLAKALTRIAAKAGANAVKFQAFVPDEKLFCEIDGDKHRYKYWNETALTDDEWREVFVEARLAGIHLILSIFQLGAVKFLEHAHAAKVASRAVKTFPYHLTSLPLFISDGMITAAEREEMDTRLNQRPHVWMACVSAYPNSLGHALKPGWHQGLSDHSGTPWPVMAAIAQGAYAVEVHFNSGTGRGRDANCEVTHQQLCDITAFRDACDEMGLP